MSTLLKKIYRLFRYGPRYIDRMTPKEFVVVVMALPHDEREEMFGYAEAMLVLRKSQMEDK